MSTNTNLPTKFVNQPSNSLYCQICQKLFHDPVISIRCGHTFCRPCLENHVGTRAILDCPVDNKSIDVNSLVPNRALQGQLEDLLIYCRHSLHRVDSDDDFQISEDGCKEHITLGRRAEHEDHCLSAWVPCPNSSNHCGLFRKRDFEDHLLLCQHNPCKYYKKGSLFIPYSYECCHDDDPLATNVNNELLLFMSHLINLRFFLIILEICFVQYPFIFVIANQINDYFTNLRMTMETSQCDYDTEVEINHEPIILVFS